MSISTITIGGNSYTAYASVAEADEYLAVDPVRFTTWDALSTDDKGKRLVAATRRLDLLRWAGEKTGGSAAQDEQWPRTGVKYPDGTDVSTSEVPQAVENATILMAGSIAITAANAGAGTSGSNRKRLKAGSAEIEFFRPTAGKALQDETAYALVTPYLAGVDASAIGPLASGTDAESSFTESPYYGLNKGYP